MKHIHSTAGTAVVALLLSSPLLLVRADSPGDHPDAQKMHQHMEEREGKHLDAMTKKLNLTPEQQTTVKAALNDQKSKMEALRKESGEKMKAVHEETKQKINAVLTDDQKKKYAAMEAEMKEKMEQRWKEHKGGDHKDGGETPEK